MRFQPLMRVERRTGMSLKDKINYIVMCFGYGCIALLIYALLFGEVKIG